MDCNHYVIVLILLISCLFDLSKCEGGDLGFGAEFPLLGALFSAASKAFDKLTPDECYQLNRRGITRGPIGVILAALPYKSNYPVIIFKDGWQQPDYLIAAMLIEMWHRYRAAESLFDPNKYKGASKLLGAQAFWGKRDDGESDDLNVESPRWSVWWSQLGDFFSGVNELMDILIGGTIPLFVSTRGAKYNSRFLLSTLNLYAKEKLETITYLRGGTTKDSRVCCGVCNKITPVGGSPSHLGIFTDVEGSKSYSALHHLQLLYDKLEDKDSSEEEVLDSPMDEWAWDSEYSYIGAFIIYVRKLQQRYHSTFHYANRNGRVVCGLHINDITKSVRNLFDLGRKSMVINNEHDKSNNVKSRDKISPPPWNGSDQKWKNNPKSQIISILQFLDEEDLNTTSWDTLDYVIAAAFQYLRIRKHLHQIWTGGWLHYQTSPNIIKKIFKAILRLCRMGGKHHVI
ncbi:uncharacterized protein CMU_013970 [Cryptosporidium muris RN66]|uniref:Uncharacterized protein n=1 Tax=Cryptosporidium muris (strain RN66) TaxID=441375 RepID=B6AEV5_CRYMR|nr:uncharacterized protein CMU_013970 [Cryptosporidium muris RN66]EEA06722.1 hypothetical protein, conserved [Cryptosporidium muris RN66]|eukprot:XP_002141071.1 hypothetical protein [Cryptosporidium muris RN66]